MIYDPTMVTEAGLENLKRIRSIAQSRKTNTQLVATRFILERVVSRLFTSDHADLFALKGGLIIMHAEGVDPVVSRATEDIDLQIPGFDGAIEDFAAICREALSMVPETDDGVRFDLGTMKVFKRLDDNVPGGTLHVPAQIGNMRVKFKVDVTFDSRPAFTVAVSDEMPSVIPDRYAPVPVRRIPLSWTLADKLQALVRHGEDSTRFRDFYDMYLILSRNKADPQQTVEAMRMTFDLFRCEMPGSVDEIGALSDRYAMRNAAAWERECRQRRFAVQMPDFQEVVSAVREAARPLVNACQPSMACA